MSNQTTDFANLDTLVTHLREKLDEKKYLLLFAYNGTGKTRLSMAFKEAGKTDDGADTLYFNAFTEDLFVWDNDLDNDTQRVLKINKDSRFFEGLQALEMENRIRPLLQRYADLNFVINYDDCTINFIREDKRVSPSESIEHIKISRGEENIFVWCFFLAIAQLAIDSTEEEEPYHWVKYIYIDDPISSLDDNNAIAVASHLSQLLKSQSRIKTVISSHHTLFFNVLCNELKKAIRYFLSHNLDGYYLRDTKETPRFYHVAMLKELHQVAESGQLYTYHFTILRSIIEKTATFHGFNHIGDILKKEPNDEDGALHYRYIQLLSHGNYSLLEPVEMLDENKEIFCKILNNFMQDYRFNPDLFPPQAEQTNATLEEAAQL